MEQRKNVKDLNLLDRFLFAEAMDDPQFAQDVLQIILGDQFILKETPQTEKEQRNLSLHKMVRLDVWAKNEAEDIVDIEAQNTNTRNLPKRSRYYQAMIDVNQLEPGDIDYNKLANVYIIMITSFDLFGKDRYRYTFTMGCHEEDGMPLSDGITRIFLNTRGKDDENISEELKMLLQFFENTDAHLLEHTSCQQLQRIRQHIIKLKSSEELGVKYMREWEEKIYIREEGHAAGLVEGQLKVAVKLKNMGVPIEQIQEATDLTREEIEKL